jgi:hypothetical protein
MSLANEISDLIRVLGQISRLKANLQVYHDLRRIARENFVLTEEQRDQNIVIKRTHFLEIITNLEKTRELVITALRDINDHE